MYRSNQNINDNIKYSHAGQLWAAESKKNLEKETMGSDLFHFLQSYQQSLHQLTSMVQSKFENNHAILLIFKYF